MQIVIIDDEQPAVNLLSSFVKKIPFLNLEFATTNAFEALDLMNRVKVDLILLDIEMPDITGIEFLNSLKNPPMIIFTTAYEAYALQGYELDIVDYLLKPIRFERFLKGVNKAHKIFREQSNIQQTKIQQSFIIVKVDYQNRKVELENILYIEGYKDYVKIHTRQEKILTRLNLKGIEEKLPKDLFVRIHRSYIVSISKITAFQKSQVTIAETNLPVGDKYRGNLPFKLD